MAGPDFAHRITHGRTTAGAHAFFLDWPVVHSEYDGITATYRSDVHSTLCARALLRKSQLASYEIHLGFGEQNSHLQRKTMLVIHFLVQRIIVVRSEFDDDRRGTHLASIVAQLDKIGMASGILNTVSLKVIPAIGNPRKLGVERFAKASNDIRQRVAKGLVFAAPEPVSRHHGSASEKTVILVSGGQSAALCRR